MLTYPTSPARSHTAERASCASADETFSQEEDGMRAPSDDDRRDDRDDDLYANVPCTD
jgi:hypothetical protein